jgi:hypothetical protein
MADESLDPLALEPDNVSHLDMIAIQLNEMYISLQRGGFPQHEALQLIGMVISNGISYEPPEDEEEEMPRAQNDDEDEFDIFGEYGNEDGDDFV